MKTHLTLPYFTWNYSRRHRLQIRTRSFFIKTVVVLVDCSHEARSTLMPGQGQIKTHENTCLLGFHTTWIMHDSIRVIHDLIRCPMTWFSLLSNAFEFSSLDVFVQWLLAPRRAWGFDVSHHSHSLLRHKNLTLGDIKARIVSVYSQSSKDINGWKTYKLSG